MVPSAELRVYQPLEAFSPEEQSRWERYIVEGWHLRPRHARYRQRVTPKGLGVLAEGGEGADVRLAGGSYYVCPWRTRLRVLAGLLAFREAAPFEGSQGFVTRDDARKATRELTRLRKRDPSAISHIMQSPWHVPVRWFVLFADDERHLVEERGRHRLKYVTTARRAIRRAEKTIPVLRRTDLSSVADVIVELHEWLSSFDPRSIVELDYGRLSDFLTWDDLDNDHSARDLQDAVNALSSEEFPRSAELYQAVIGHWAEVRGHESLN
ncbi:MAG TPA: hypothetical protein VF984_10020 [Actinomycetota bacterium]